MEKLHSLLERLLTEGHESRGLRAQTDSSNESQEGQTKIESSATAPIAAKSKEFAVMVEELRSLMDDQKGLISQLLTELSSSEKENSVLKNQVSTTLSVPFILSPNV